MTTEQIKALQSSRIVITAEQCPHGWRISYYDDNMKLRAWNREVFATKEDCETLITDMCKTRPYRFVGHFNTR
jgi:hypothetical protein